jgi:hypothetical protein
MLKGPGAPIEMGGDQLFVLQLREGPEISHLILLHGERCRHVDPFPGSGGVEEVDFHEGSFKSS